jgi:hypothetical protein
METVRITKELLMCKFRVKFFHKIVFISNSEICTDLRDF